jgi:hypothetical protein
VKSYDETPYQLALRRRAERAESVPESTTPVLDTTTAPPALLTEAGGKTLLTFPIQAFDREDSVPVPPELAAAWEQAAGHNPYYLWLQGRFVEAEKANANGAFWSRQELEMGQASVAHGPLNWLHDSRQIIGHFADAQLMQPALHIGESAADAGRPHIAAAAVMYKHLFPEQANKIRDAAVNKSLYYSMECVGRTVSCETSADGSRQGCGKEYPYLQTVLEPASCCPHIAQKTSQRAFHGTVFLGGAVIVPPVAPAWRNADVELVQKAAAEAERTAEAASAFGISSDRDWAALVTSVLSYATAA